MDPGAASRAICGFLVGFMKILVVFRDVCMAAPRMYGLRDACKDVSKFLK